MLEEEIEYAEQIISLLSLQSSIGLIIIIAILVYGSVQFWHSVLSIFI